MSTERQQGKESEDQPQNQSGKTTPPEKSQPTDVKPAGDQRDKPKGQNFEPGAEG